MIRNYLLAFIATITLTLHMQTAMGQGLSVNTTGAAADTSAMLDVSSSSKGLLMPRMTGAQRDAIHLPANGLEVYITDAAQPGLYINNGTPAAPLWSPVGSSMPAGSTAGDMLYWNGSAWVVLPAGITGQVLVFDGHAPVWAGVPSLPTVTVVTSLTVTLSGFPVSETAAVHGEITNPLGIPVLITGKGICWGTHSNPTIATDSFTTDGAGLSSFTETFSGTPLVTYYARAYVSNSVGTVYGNEVTFSVAGIGSPYLGGILGYVLQPSDFGYSGTTPHGLIMYPKDSGIVSRPWGCFNTLSFSTGTGFGDGPSNTSTIVFNCGTNTAAGYCRSLTTGGYTDWYLPSVEEALALSPIAGNIYFPIPSGGFWTSSGGPTPNLARSTDFLFSIYTSQSPFNLQPVLAIRSF